MNKNIQKAAKKLYKQLKGDITFAAIENHLKKLGYRILFYNTPAGDAELERYGLKEKALKLKAFTYCSTAKIVFINNLFSVEDKFYLSLHETAHITLKHLEPGRIFMSNGILLDIEADAFVHYLLDPQQSPSRTVAVCTFLAIATMSAIFYNSTMNTNTTAVSNMVTQSEGIVYITSTGDKFHTPNCGTITGRAVAQITRAEALKIHEPCSMCNP